MDRGDLLSYFWSFIAVLWFSVAALIVGSYVWEDWWFLVRAVGVTAICTGFVWYYLVENTEASVLKRGVLAGFVIGLLVHPAFFIFFRIFSLEFEIGDPILAMFFSLLSLMTPAVLSIPGGIIAGLGLGVVRYLIDPYVETWRHYPDAVVE